MLGRLLDTKAEHWYRSLFLKVHIFRAFYELEKSISYWDNLGYLRWLKSLNISMNLLSFVCELGAKF